ncbi:hypothetical protein G6N82_06095 [Altererythrobacter sp. BO-6]|uniref:VapE domain-containing protein n=1 Tax=Altererythrobacter sp. BO-6 TaxID=2604537 RepID=UPI0013E13E8B|nr:VapE domain-containing protein [Altererythrobacter sp. BO-6]QIG53782.1 hypothetical protein G6N82_06095 [Altererythrobacter sp. BO-6]
MKKDDFPHQPAEGAVKLPITKENVEHMLAESGVTVSYDVIKKRRSYERAGSALTFSDLIGLANLNGLNSPWFGDFVQEIAEANPTNPVKAWIESQPWDGTDRLMAFYETVEADEDYPTGFKCLLLNRWLRSAVAAAVKDYFRNRGVLTFQGPQGCGKTSWIAALAPPDKRAELVKLDHHLDPHNKDSVYIGVSHWFTEIGELDSSFKRDISRLKGFLTNDCDKIRLPYTKTPIEMKRRTVFAASVNDPNFLIDATGNTRFWTIPVVKLHYDHDIDMQQVFAQVLVDVRAGKQWWLTPEEEAMLEEQNARFKAVSVIEERLLDALNAKSGPAIYMTAMEVLRALDFNSPSNNQCRECGAVLRHKFGPPKRVQGRARWKVPMKPSEGFHRRQEPDPDEY